MLRRLTPNLMVEDVNKTVQYYEEILACFELVAVDPKKGKYDWAMMRCEDVEIMFQSKDSLIKVIPELNKNEMGGAFVLYIEVEEIGSLYARIKDKVKIIKGLHTTPYGMNEFIIQDCNGFILVFSQWT